MGVKGTDEKNQARYTENRNSSDVNFGVIEAEVIANRPKLNGTTLNVVLGFVAGTGFTLFGFVFSL